MKNIENTKLILVLNNSKTVSKLMQGTSCISGNKLNNPKSGGKLIKMLIHLFS